MKQQYSATTTSHCSSTRLGLCVLSLVLLLFLAACSSRQPSNSPNAPAGQGAIPGKEEFGMTREELFTAIENVEAEISTCMQRAGFEYVAVDYNTVRQGMTADKSLPGMNEDRFIQEYGLGISTLYTGLAPQLSELRTPAQIGLGEQNVRIYQNLSPADQVAYSQTLFGEHPDATLAVALEAEDLSWTGGCTRTAIEKSFTPEQMSSAYVNPFDVLIDQDPRMVEANARFAECMRAAGFEYNHVKDVEVDLRKKLDTITGGAPLEALSPDALAALQELQSYERGAAVAAVNCEESFLDPVANQVEREYYAGPQQ